MIDIIMQTLKNKKGGTKQIDLLFSCSNDILTFKFPH